jgi:hypothetical protein
VNNRGTKHSACWIIGATPDRRNDGLRESACSWRELLLDLKRRGHIPLRHHNARAKSLGSRVDAR